MKSKSWSIIGSNRSQSVKLAHTDSAWLLLSPHPLDDLARDHREGEHPIGEPSLGDVARHPPDDGGGLILSHHLSAGGADRFAAPQAVLTHSGEDHRQRIG